MYLKIVFLFLLSILLTQCGSKEVNYKNEPPNKLTLGKIQQTLKQGMSQGEIVTELGSPNMVTSDANGLETWVYDKLSTEVSAENKKKGFNLLGGAIGGKLGVGGVAGSTTNTSNSSTSQKTLTLILKFKDKKLDTFSYNASSF